MKYTIAIPAYKIDYLKECIESVLNQTIHDFELIIVDDASPYPIHDIVSKFNDSRITYFRNETNSGAVNIVDNWNRCLSLAHGEYFCLMGDDDILGEDYLAEIDRISQLYPNVSVIHGRTAEINEKTEKTKVYEAWPEWQSVYDLIWHRISRLRVTFISDFTFRTETLRQCGGFYKLPLAWASDDISVYQAAENHGIAATNKIIFYYRRHCTSITSSGSTEIKLQAISEEFMWLTQFINRAIPQSDTDRILHLMIRNRIKIHIDYRRALEVCQAWRAKKYKLIIKLIFRHQTYNLSLPLIGKGILMAIGNRNYK